MGVVEIMRYLQQSFKNRMANRKLWTQEEDSVILGLINTYGTSQWIAVAAEMKKLCSSWRTSKQIRQRWYNQLSPEVTKAPWSHQEEAQLFHTHSVLGSRWKQIAAQLSGRTDNAVKNHFYSTVRRALRRMDKHFGFRDSTRKMRDLKPSALTHFLEVGQTLPSYTEMMDLILVFAQWKPKRQASHSFKENAREIYQQILQLINCYKKCDKVKKEKEIIKGETIMMLDAESTESDKMMMLEDEEEEGGEGEIFNYFGSQIMCQSWFNDEKEPEIICDNNLMVACEDHQQ